MSVDRPSLRKQLNELPPQQLNDLIFDLKPPRGIIPPPSAPQGDRAIALLEWAEGTGGVGLEAVQTSLEVITFPVRSYVFLGHQYRLTDNRKWVRKGKQRFATLKPKIYEAICETWPACQKLPELALDTPEGIESAVKSISEVLEDRDIAKTFQEALQLAKIVVNMDIANFCNCSEE